jgi:hypothetical protein
MSIVVASCNKSFMLFQYVIYEDCIASQADDLQLDIFACFYHFFKSPSFLPFRVSHVLAMVMNSQQEHDDGHDLSI